MRPGATPLVVFGPPRRGPGRGSFLLLPVFDLSQTDGQPLPTLDTTLHGETTAVSRLEAAATKLGIWVVELRGPGSLVGASVGGEIRVRADVSSQERAATMAHELAHELLHQQSAANPKPPELTTTEKETEAESTAYLVLRVLGLPSKAPAYVAWQGGDGRLVLRGLRRVQQAAKRILEAALGARRLVLY